MRIALLASFLVFSLWLSAQVPQGIKYQAVARSSQGQVVTNQIIGLEISILQGGPTGQLTYMETHRPTTNEFGLFTIVIGDGTAIQGTFNNIDWSLGEYFLRTSLDINGGNNYAFMGTSQLLSVPYALYAERTSKSDNDFDQDSTNELQTLDLTGTTLSISNGNSVQLGGTVDLDGDPTNEIQQLSINGTQLNLSNGGGSVTLPADNDSDPNNEIQTISSSATGTDRTITLSQSNATTIDVADNDNDASNELQDLSSAKAGNEVTIDISNGVGTTINVDDADADPENELQQLSINGDTIKLTQNGGEVVIETNIPSGYCIFKKGDINVPDGFELSSDIQFTSSDIFEIDTLTNLIGGLSGATRIGISGQNIVISNSQRGYLYNSANNSWNQINMPTNVGFLSEVTYINHQNDLYLIGGSTTGIFKLDTINLNWTQVASFNCQLIWTQAIAVDSLIYIVSGYNTAQCGTCNVKCFTFNPMNNTLINNLPDLPIAIRLGNLAHKDGFLYIFNGEGCPNLGNNNNVYKLNITNSPNNWQLAYNTRFSEVDYGINHFTNYIDNNNIFIYINSCLNCDNLMSYGIIEPSSGSINKIGEQLLTSAPSSLNYKAVVYNDEKIYILRDNSILSLTLKNYGFMYCKL